MSLLYSDILQGFKEIAQMQGNKEVESIIDQNIENQNGLNENTITSTLPPSIDKFLMDMSQMYIDDLSYNDISKFGDRATEEDIKQLRKYKRELSQGFEEDDPEVKEIFDKIKNIVKGLDENMNLKEESQLIPGTQVKGKTPDGRIVTGKLIGPGYWEGAMRIYVDNPPKAPRRSSKNMHLSDDEFRDLRKQAYYNRIAHITDVEPIEE